MEIKGLKINFLGDSITAGSGASDKETCFVSLMQNKYGAVSRNYGIGGTRIARKVTPSENAVYDQDYCGRFSEMDDDADMVFVFGGTNDFGHGDAPLGKFTDRTEYTFYGALHTLFTGLINKYPTSKICVITPLHRLVEEKPEYKLIDFVNAVREVAEFYSLPVLDLYANLGINPQVPVMKETYMPDGLHPNDRGYEIIAEKVAAFIRNM
ncbi:MAG: SGNH/GDSL hydrolase family protein [Clostridia bacterium]|nr:SGNH/GDSL hydrolase family protein [Clostridia bacterium]